MSIVLLVGAALLTTSLRNLERQQFGFVTDGRLIVSLINPEAAGYTDEKLPALYQGLETALPQIPGVLSASLSTYSPLAGNNWNEWVYIEGKPPGLHRHGSFVASCRASLFRDGRHAIAARSRDRRTRSCRARHASPL